MAAAFYTVLDGNRKSRAEMQSTATFRTLKAFFTARPSVLLTSNDTPLNAGTGVLLPPTKPGGEHACIPAVEADLPAQRALPGPLAEP